MNGTARNERYQLEIELLRLERQAEENKAALRQAKYALREAKVAAAEYGGSFRSFRDRLTGKKEAAETALRHEAQKAESALASAQREKEILDARLPELKETLAALPEWNALNDGSDAWNRLEVLLCAEAVAPVLTQTRQALTERRNMANGAVPGKIYTFSEQAEIGCAPEKAAEACKPYLARLKSALENLGLSFPNLPFFENPAAFLNAATEYTRKDRLHEAFLQAEDLQRLIVKLRREPEE